MKKGLLNKRIPTILGLFFLLIGILAGLYFISQGRLMGSKSNPKSIPKNILITNISDNQFTVSWTTEEPTIGFIKYADNPSIKTTINDDRDQLNGEQNKYYSHYITIKDLLPSNTYYFKIGSSGQLYDNNSEAYKITLGPTLGSSGEAKIISGRILDQNNNPFPGAIVYLNSANIAPMSSITDKEGRWAIFLNKTRVVDLTSYAVFDPEASILKIEVASGQQQASAITITKNAFPVPDIILGHVPYDFREEAVTEKLPLQAEAAPQQPEKTKTFLQENLEEAKASPSPEASSSASPDSPQQSTESADLTENAEPEENQEGEIPSQFNAEPLNQVTIENPAEDGEEINTTLPEITGKGPAAKVLTIRIESPETYTSTVTVDGDGQWNFTPPEDLTPGDHTVFVSYVDDEGTTKTISRNFVVLAAGQSELPALTATPSATQAPSPIPSPSTRGTIPSTESGVPTTGTVIPTFMVFIAGLLLLILGFISKIAIDNNNKIKT